MNLFQAVIDFFVLLVPLGVIGFVAYKLGQPLLERLMKKHSLSWIKACVVLNFAVVFLWLMFFYFYFLFIGAAGGVPVDEEAQLTIFENMGIVLFDGARIAFSAVVIALALLFFEFVASLIISVQEKTRSPKLLKQLIGIFGAAALFLVLVLFFFDWALLGMFIFTFYGKIKAIPLVILITSGAVL